MQRWDGGRPALNVEATAGLLEGGVAQADLARGVLELEVEEALQHLIADPDVARRSMRILSFLAARKVKERCAPLRYDHRSAVVRYGHLSAVVREPRNVFEKKGHEVGTSQRSPGDGLINARDPLDK